MRSEEDAFGQILWAHHNGKRIYEIIERDDGYIDASDPQQYFSSYQEWSPHTQKAMKHVKGKVLDIGCGAGRHSLYLQEKGFDVLGTDVSPLAIKVCKLRGLKKAKVISIEGLSFEPGSFDTILMLGNNFGLFGSLHKARELLGRFNVFSSEDAVIIAETLDPYRTENPAHLEYHELNRNRGRMGGQVRIRVRFGEYATSWYDYLFVSREEMVNIVRDTGWRVKQFIDSDSTGYVAVIEKHA